MVKLKVASDNDGMPGMLWREINLPQLIYFIIITHQKQDLLSKQAKK